MIKTRLFLLIAILLFIVICFAVYCIFYNSKTSHPKETVSIIANDIEIPVEGSLVYKNYAVLPLLKTLECFDVQIRWSNESDAILSYGNVNMNLCLDEKSLMDENGWEWLMPLPGEQNHYCAIKEHEVYVNNTTVSSLLYKFGIKITVSFDYESARVTVFYRQDST